MANTLFSICLYENVLTSPAVITVSSPCFLNSLQDERQMAVQLLFYEVLLPGLVSNSKRHYCRVPISFSSNFFVKWCNCSVVLTLLQLGRVPVLFHQRDRISRLTVNSSTWFIYALQMIQFRGNIYIYIYIYKLVGQPNSRATEGSFFDSYYSEI